MTFILEEPTESDGPIPEDLILTAEVISVVTKKKIAYVTKEEYERVDFKFQINDPDSPWDGRILYGETSTAFKRHPQCKLYAWAQEIKGQDLVGGYELSLDELAGHTVRIVTGSRTYEKDGETKVYSFVSDVMRARQSSAMSAF